MKEIRGCKKKELPPVTSRLHHAAHAQLTIFREKMCHPNSARQPVKPTTRVRSQVLDRESRREGPPSLWGALSRRRAVEGKEGETKSAGGPIECCRSVSFFKEFLPRPLSTSFISLPSIRDFLLPSLPSSISSAAFLSPSARRTSYMPRSGYKISRVYAGWIRLAWP